MRRFFSPFLFLLLGIYSCVFSPDKENFVEIDQNVAPPEISNQTLDLNSDTLFVWKYTRFNFDLRSSNQKISSVVIWYDLNTETKESSSGYFEINPETLSEGMHKLEINVFSHSGTGSLADLAGAEGFVFKKEWILIVQHPIIPEMNISATIENGFLKFSWNRVESPNFFSYGLEIRNTGHSIKKEFKQNIETTYVDSAFVGGEVYAALSYNYINNFNLLSSSVSEFTFNYPINCYFKEDLDSLRISWDKNPFHSCKQIRILGYDKTFEVNTDTFYFIPAMGLGETINYEVKFGSLKSSVEDTYTIYGTFVNGENDKQNHIDVVYNPILKKYFYKDLIAINSTDLNFKTTGHYSTNFDYREGTIGDFSGDNQILNLILEEKLVSLRTTDLNLLNAQELNIKLENGDGIRIIKWLNDSTLMLGTKQFFAIYNYVSKKIIFQSELHNKGGQENYQYSISSNGRFAAFTNGSEFVIYENIDNEELKVQFKSSEQYSRCFFNPNDPNELILDLQDLMEYKGSKRIDIFDCSEGKIKKSLTGFKSQPINIDPQTGYLLMVSFSKRKIYVYDYKNDVLKFEMNHHGTPDDFKLLNNIIFVNSGYHFDISSHAE